MLTAQGLTFAVACADTKVMMLASALEGMRDVMQKGFADIAVMKQLVVENMPRLIAKTAGKADDENVKLTTAEVTLAVSSSQPPTSSLLQISVIPATA